MQSGLEDHNAALSQDAKPNPDQQTYHTYIQQFMSSSGLLTDPKFVAFISDIVLNSPDVFSEVQPAHTQGEHGWNAVSADEKQPLQVPVLDRFMKLLMSLDNPTFQKSLRLGDNVFQKEFGLTNELNTPERALGFRAANDPEYLLKYQLVALAKYHNYYGKLDEYMKEFAAICYRMVDKPHIARNLERALNTEISIAKPSNKQLLEAYKTLPRELDPLVLA